jgi:hypothetical protein
MKCDDSSLSHDQLKEVKKHVRLLLLKANAIGRFPTPVDDILQAAHLMVDDEACLSTDSLHILLGFKSALGKRVRPLVSGLKKILGLLHVPSGQIYLDHSQHANKLVWIKFHETGHGCLPHQRKLYQLLEDGEYELSPETDDLFEREANNFAAETLFQLDTFEKIAADYVLSIKTPIDLQRKFGGSIYANMRRYASTHFAPLSLAVYDTEEIGDNRTLFRLRRKPFASSAFLRKFGSYGWPDPCAKGHSIWHLLKYRRLGEDESNIKDLNGEDHICKIHIFNNGDYQTSGTGFVRASRSN